MTGRKERSVSQKGWNGFSLDSHQSFGNKKKRKKRRAEKKAEGGRKGRGKREAEETRMIRKARKTNPGGQIDASRP